MENKYLITNYLVMRIKFENNMKQLKEALKSQ